MSIIKSSTAKLLRRYLNGAITAPEEAELERRAQRDPVLADAMLGLQSTPEEDHTARVSRMTAHARSTVTPNTLRKAGRGRTYWAAAAAVLLLFVSSALFFLPQWLDMAPGDMALKTEAPPASQAEPAPKTDNYAPAEPEDDEVFAEEMAPPPPSPKTSASSAQRPKPEKPNQLNRPKPADPAAVRKAEQRAGQEAPVLELEDAADLSEEVVVAEAEPELATPPPPAARVQRAPLPAPVSKKKSDRVDELFRADEEGNIPLVAGNYLEGLITDEDGAPIYDALVRQPGLPLGERTDTSGLFRLSYDATTTLLIVSHPDYLVERIELTNDRKEDLQISLERKELKANDDILGWTQNAARSEIVFDQRPGYAVPREGYAALRRRIENNRPEDVPLGKVRLSFLVNQDGTLTDFKFRGRPSRATMDYIGETLIKSSIWEIRYGDEEEPVRVFFKVVFQ